ncbi:MAG: hypothetical protein OEX02_16330 [Cyclobacteriaceae bacterium]|nr:hypothetical protein [Cyclobacteriaceae bacterium]
MYNLRIKITIFIVYGSVLAGVLALTSCRPQSGKEGAEMIPVLEGNLVQEVSGVGVDARHSYFSKDAQGRSVFCWSEKVDTVNYVLTYAIYNGNEFSTPVKITETVGLQVHGESMGKVLINPKGVITAIFRLSTPTKENRFLGTTYYTQSKDGGKSWSVKTPLVTDPKSTSQSFYDIENLADGTTGLVWLDNRKEDPDATGSSLYFGRFDEEGNYQGDKVVSTGTCQCCRTDIFSDSLGVVHIAWRHIFNDSIRDMAYVTSHDFGETFTSPLWMSKDNWAINGCPHTGPSLAYARGKTVATWFTLGGGKGVYFTQKGNGEDVFAQRQLVDEEAKHPQMAAIDGSFVLVYEKIRGNLSEVVFHVFDENGEGASRVISRKGSNALYPVIINDQGKMLVSWMEAANNGYRIVYTKIDLSKDEMLTLKN